jgi:hypothetical protein
MRETRSSGSVRGASGDGRPYRERYLAIGAAIGQGPKTTPNQQFTFAAANGRFGCRVRPMVASSFDADSEKRRAVGIPEAIFSAFPSFSHRRSGRLDVLSLENGRLIV